MRSFRAWLWLPLLLASSEALLGENAQAVVLPPAVVHRLLSDSASRSRTIVLEASWDDPSNKHPGEYASARIPGALRLNTDDLENGYPKWHLKPISELRAALGRLGVGDDSVVVIYSDRTVTAARAWWVLHYAGVPKVYVLNGGLAAWRRAGYRVDSSLAAVSRRPRRRALSAAPRTGTLATADDIARPNPSRLLVDLRTRDEFEGRSSGYAYLAAKGRIPGAITAGNADDSTGTYQHADGTFLTPQEVREIWRPMGILDAGAAGEVVFYCGSGWRSSLGFLYAFELGLRGIRNYSDGWSDWSTTYEQIPGFGGITPGWKQTPSGRPVETGTPPSR